MDVTMVSGLILSALSAIQSILPLLGVGGASASAVTGIIAMLVKIEPMLVTLAPLAGNEISLIYQGMKNIIANMRSDSVTTTAQQDADLDAIDARVDAAWNTVSMQFDPDAAQTSS